MYDPPHVPSKTWRELIKKVWEVDPLTCPQCGSEMRIISLIQDPDVIRRILEHLGQPAPQSLKSDFLSIFLSINQLEADRYYRVSHVPTGVSGLVTLWCSVVS